MAMSKRWYWSTALCSYLSNSRASEIERISSRNYLIVLNGRIGPMDSALREP
jgi:hypothetical protein